MRYILVIIFSSVIGGMIGAYLSLRSSQDSYATWVREVDIGRSFELEQEARSDYAKKDPKSAYEKLIISKYLIERNIDDKTPHIFFPFLHANLRLIDINSKKSTNIHDCTLSHLRKKIGLDISFSPESTNAACPPIAEEFLRIR